MATEYKLSYTATEIDEKLGKIDSLVATVNGNKPDENGNVDVAVSGGGGGLSGAAASLLINILRNGVFSNDQSANITALETALGASGGEEEPDTPVVPDEPVGTTYTITAELVNVTSSNAATSINENASYTATLTASDGYTLDGASVTVTMGGVDITSIAYDDGVIFIASVTGNIEIIASAVQIEETPAELNMDGLVFNFDFRNAAMESYNLSGWGNVYKTLDKTGNALIFGTSEATGDDIGLKNYGFRDNRQAANETADIELGTKFTVQALYKDAQPSMFGWGVGSLQDGAIKFRGTYFAGTTEKKVDDIEVKANTNGYHVLTYAIDENIAKIYWDGENVLTLDGASYDGFTKWRDSGAPNVVWSDNGYATAFVGYNRAMNQQEIVENIAYFKTMEVA